MQTNFDSKITSREHHPDAIIKSDTRSDYYIPLVSRSGSHPRVLPSVAASIQRRSKDVLLGRGNIRWEGNQKFQTVIRHFCKRYNDTESRSDKGKIVSEIVNIVHGWGGRFLCVDTAKANNHEGPQQNRKSAARETEPGAEYPPNRYKRKLSWVLANNKQIRKKVGQAIRYKLSENGKPGQNPTDCIHQAAKQQQQLPSTQHVQHSVPQREEKTSLFASKRKRETAHENNVTQNKRGCLAEKECAIPQSDKAFYDRSSEFSNDYCIDIEHNQTSNTPQETGSRSSSSTTSSGATVIEDDEGVIGVKRRKSEESVDISILMEMFENDVDDDYQSALKNKTEVYNPSDQKSFTAKNDKGERNRHVSQYTSNICNPGNSLPYSCWWDNAEQRYQGDASFSHSVHTKLFDENFNNGATWQSNMSLPVSDDCVSRRNENQSINQQATIQREGEFGYASIGDTCSLNVSCTSAGEPVMLPFPKTRSGTSTKLNRTTVSPVPATGNHIYIHENLQDDNNSSCSNSSSLDVSLSAIQYVEQHEEEQNSRIWLSSRWGQRIQPPLMTDVEILSALGYFS